VDQAGERDLPDLEQRIERRGTMAEPPGDPGKRQDEDREAGRLVRVHHRGAHRPFEILVEEAQHQIESDQGRDDPVQPDGNSRIAGEVGSERGHALSLHGRGGGRNVPIWFHCGLDNPT
jgi:hypothetical protein